MTTDASARWDLLFADLEAQAFAADRAIQRGEIAELTRAEQANVTLEQRLRSSIGTVIGVELLDGESLGGLVQRVSTSWILVEGRGASGAAEHLVPLSAVAAVTGLSRHAVPSVARIDGLGLGTVLRQVQRDRAHVIVRTLGGHTVGRLSRVGQDHFDLEETERAPVRLRTVPFAALLRVTRA
jgi:hypothetical protein